MPLAKRMLILLACASFLAGAAFVFWQHEDRRAGRLAEEARLLAETEREMTVLARDIRRYEEAKGRIGQASGLARHEKVALAARFSPEELSRLPEVLQRAYGGDGFLLLRRFSLAWREQGELALELAGEKVFLH